MKNKKKIANRDKFPGIHGEDWDFLRVIRGIFHSIKSLLYINLVITMN